MVQERHAIFQWCGHTEYVRIAQKHVPEIDLELEQADLIYLVQAVRPTVQGCNFAPDVVNLNNLGEARVQDFSTSCGRR